MKGKKAFIKIHSNRNASKSSSSSSRNGKAQVLNASDEESLDGSPNEIESAESVDLDSDQQQHDVDTGSEEEEVVEEDESEKRHSKSRERSSSKKPPPLPNTIEGLDERINDLKRRQATLSLLKNKQHRRSLFESIRHQVIKCQLKKKKLIKTSGVQRPVQQQKTIENMRVHDETSVEPNDPEVLEDEAADEFASYFDRSIEPRILITTTDFPRVMTRTFCSELSLVIPNADYIKRKPIGVKQIVEQGIAHGYTDLLIVNEKDKKPCSLLHVHLPNGPTAFFRVSSVRLIRETRTPRALRKARRRVTDPYRELRHAALCPEPSTSTSSMPTEVKSEAEEEQEQEQDGGGGDDEASDEDVVKSQAEPEEKEGAGEDCQRAAAPDAAPDTERMQMELDSSDGQDTSTRSQHTSARGAMRLATGSLIRGRVFIERPELVINNMRTRLGRSLARMFAALFPADANLAARRVVAFHNQRDFVFFRHYKYVFSKNCQKASLREIGPRFTLKLRWLQRGTFDTRFGEFEWSWNRHEYEKCRRKFFM